jgi:voltage-gated potassium channel
MWVRALRKTAFYLTVSGLFMAVMLVGFTLFYHEFEHYPGEPDRPLSLLDSFYFTVITTRTIGFGDIHPQTTLGKLGTICNALLPATIFMGASLMVLQAAFQSLEEWWRSFLMARNTDHAIIVADADLLPSIISEHRARSKPFVVVHRTAFDDLPDELAGVLDDQCYLSGDPGRDDVLKRARVDEASGILIATSDDSVNLYVLVTAKGLNSQIRATVRVNGPHTEAKFRTVGADHLMPSTSVLGRLLSQAASQPVTNEFMVRLSTRTQDPYLVESEPTEQQHGQPLRHLFPNAVAVRRDGVFHYDLAELAVQRGDNIICIATEQPPV